MPRFRYRAAAEVPLRPVAKTTRRDLEPPFRRQHGKSDRLTVQLQPDG